MANAYPPQRFGLRIVIDVPPPALPGPIIWVPEEGSERFVPHVVPPEPPLLLIEK